MKMIGVMAHTSAGKGTFGGIVRGKYGFQEVSLADPMKRFCMEVLGFPEEYLWGPSEMRELPHPRGLKRVDGEPLTARYALQTLGTEWGRNCHNDVWVDYLIDILGKIYHNGFYRPERGIVKGAYMDRPQGIVIPDVRFSNEILKLQALECKVVKIVREGKTGEGHTGVPGHESESGQDSIPDSMLDAIIYAKEGVENYTPQVLEFLSEHPKWVEE